MRNVMLAAAALLGCSSAQAVTYNVVQDFGPTSTIWTYGYGTVGGSFTELTNYVASGCVGTPDLACHNNPADSDYTFPAFGKNVGNSDPLVFYTNELAKDALFVQTLTTAQAILRFTAPTTGLYTFSGSFQRLDNMNGAGDGVNVGYYFNGSTFSSDLATVMGSTFGINTQIALTGGGNVDFFLGAKGNVFNDGTALRLSASVPETATWAMMVGGFGLLGAMTRRKRSVSITA